MFSLLVALVLIVALRSFREGEEQAQVNQLGKEEKIINLPSETEIKLNESDISQYFESSSILTDISSKIRGESITLTGKLIKPVKINTEITALLQIEQNNLRVEITQMKLGPLPAPNWIRNQLVQEANAILDSKVNNRYDIRKIELYEGYAIIKVKGE